MSRKTKRKGHKPHGHGRLESERWIELHTDLANSVFDGRKQETDADGVEKARIIGLRGFADVLRIIWYDARRDNPYADWWMLKVERGLNDAARELEITTKEYRAILDERSCLEVRVLGSPMPHRRWVSFKNPLAYNALRLLSQLDNLLMVVLECANQNLISRNEATKISHAAAAAIVRTLRIALAYKHYELTRKDLRNGTAYARRAVEHMGTVPKCVLEGTQRSGCAPPIHHQPAKQTPFPYREVV